MEVNLSPEVQAKLTRMASERGCDPETLAREAIDRLVSYDEWFLREVDKGLAEVAGRCDDTRSGRRPTR